MAVGKTSYPTMDAMLDGYIGQAMSPEQMIQALAGLWGGPKAGMTPPAMGPGVSPQSLLSMPLLDPAMIPQGPVPGLNLPTVPQSPLISGPIPQAQPMVSEFMGGPSGDSWVNGGGVPSMGQLNTPATEGPWDRYLRTWSEPGYGMQYPFARGDQNTGAGNVAAGFGNAAINLPQNMWQLYQQTIGKPAADTLGPAAASMWDFFTKKEGEVKADNAPPVNPAAGFQPGVPKGNQPQAGGTSGKIIGVESGGKANAKNPNSSAYGPGQFLKSTWMSFIKEVHPELVTAGKMGEKELLELRSDPNFAGEATSWYAGKAVDELDKLDLPATDANIYLHHFLGPGGMKSVLTADPNTPLKDLLTPEQINANKTILGGARSAGDVIDWATAKMGDTSIGPYVPGAPPPSRPQTVLPDFSAMNSWLDQAAPVAPDKALLDQTRFDNTLAGFASGVGGVNAEQAGGGAFWGSVGAGTAAGARDGNAQVTALQNQFNDQQREYAGVRAGVAQDQANVRAGAANADANSGYLDQVDMFNWTEGNRAKAEERNLLISQEAKAKEAQAKLDASPKILNSSAQGLVIQNPDGSVDMHSWDQNGQWDQIEQAGKALGMDSPAVRQMKYNQLATSGSSLMSIEMEIIKDIVMDGMGPAVFGDAWGEALTAAESQLPGGLAADPKLQLAEQQKAVMGLLLGASQEKGNYDWVIQAAALGNPGALMLTQGGSLPNE